MQPLCYAQFLYFLNTLFSSFELSFLLYNRMPGNLVSFNSDTNDLPDKEEQVPPNNHLITSVVLY